MSSFVEFPVSKPSLREAMRILEAEGLLRVRRGKLGGAVVRRPNAANVAYTVGLVLGSQEVGLSDVGNALLQVEPACAGLCAQRADRGRAVVPQLRQAARRRRRRRRGPAAGDIGKPAVP